MDVVLAVHVLRSGDHLVRQHQHRFQREATIAVVEEVLQ